jgi:hypothetical protein
MNPSIASSGAKSQLGHLGMEPSSSNNSNMFENATQRALLDVQNLSLTILKIIDWDFGT